MPKKKPAAGCKCADAVDKRLESMGGALTRNLQINFDTGKSGLSPPILVVERVGNGRKPLPTVYCTYCPFCGVKYPE